MRRFFSFFMPDGLLLLAVIFCIRSNILLVWLPAIARIYPYFVFAVAVLLGWRFNRSRLIYGVFVLFLVDRLLIHLPATNPFHTASFALIAFKSIAVLLPLNLLTFSLLKERSLITTRGVFYLILILVQLPLIVLGDLYQQTVFTRYLDFVIYPLPFLKLPLPQPAILTFFIALVLMAFYFMRDWDVMKQGFFWATVSAFMALASPKSGIISTIYFSTAGLILVISAIEATYSMAYRDELTKLPARRALNEALLKLGGKYTVAMIDIDHFKKFNDRYGHDAGDQVLRMVATKLGKVTGGGKTFRYGGEEFTIVFPGKSKDNVLQHLERLRKIIASYGFNIRGSARPKKKPEIRKKTSGSVQKISVTVSIGVAERIDKKAKPTEVVKAADKALYKAKKGGRNRVVS
ncbi:MAG: GGDEF domain-containing protein [Pseudomonadota bacterium]